MKKRIIAKVSIFIILCVCVSCLLFADGGFKMIRNGVSEALKYDFEIKGMAQELGVTFDGIGDSVEVGGESVQYYSSPVTGEIVKDYSAYSPYVEYSCKLLLTVKAATNGTIHSIVQNEDVYSVSVINSHGYEINVNGLDTIYVTYGQNVTVGQIIGKLSNDGIARVSVCKDGLPYDPENFL